ncbi:hypothetical protein SAMN04244573_04286 [Azotobacter beijerinckii]|uniref:Uncharacterized protein n=1 Tax=Azotobacter beijerinckii TaxID=170623 RepID=A0A1H9RX85_9GAMM|nr:hypothetical protein SAMN04244573_04286 [Azotobacter beijerinckii]
MERDSSAIRKAGSGQCHGTAGVGAGDAGCLDRRRVRDQPAAPVSPGAAVFHRRRADVAGFAGVTPFAACRRAPDGQLAGDRDGPVRQGQPHRARIAAGVGARQRRTAGTGRLGAGQRALPACRAGNCALSMATTCRSRKSGSSLCATSAPPPCRDIRGWSTIPTWIGSSTCRPARMPMKASAPPGGAQAQRGTGASRTASRGLGGFPLPPGGSGQKPLRGDARRAANGALAHLGRRFGQHTGAGGHQQARPQGG